MGPHGVVESCDVLFPIFQKALSSPGYLWVVVVGTPLAFVGGLFCRWDTEAHCG